MKHTTKTAREVRMHIILGTDKNGARKRWSYNATPGAVLKDGTPTEQAYREFLQRKCAEGITLECYLLVKPEGLDEKFVEGQHYTVLSENGVMKCAPVQPSKKAEQKAEKPTAKKTSSAKQKKSSAKAVASFTPDAHYCFDETQDWSKEDGRATAKTSSAKQKKSATKSAKPATTTAPKKQTAKTEPKSGLTDEEIATIVAKAVATALAAIRTK